MGLRIFVFAALRILAIYLVIQALDRIPEIVSLYLGSTILRMATELPYYWGVIVVMILTALVLWFAAGRLATGVARECDPNIQIQLTLEDAYAITFVVLGAYCVLCSLSSAVIDICRVASAVSQYPNGDTMRSQAVTDLYRAGITLAAGLAALIGHRKWARKLGRLDVKKAE